MKKAIGWLVLLVLAALVITRAFVLEPVEVSGPDMLPTLEAGHHYVVNHLAKHPERGELVLIESPGSGGKQSVRRVVGVGGDKVEYRGQQVILNGQAARNQADGQLTMEEGPFGRTLGRYLETLPASGRRYAIARDPQRKSKDQPVVAVPAGAFYVLSDNRNHGRDSREYGPVPASNVRGTVEWRVVSLWNYEKIE